MTPFQRQLGITVLLAGIAGFVGVWVGIDHLQPSVNHNPAPLRQTIDELMQRGLLGLTTAQKQQISAIEMRYAHTRMQLRARIAAANVELGNALADEMGFGPEAQASIAHLEANVGALQKATVLYILALRAVLTPPQKEVFDERVIAALMTVPH